MKTLRVFCLLLFALSACSARETVSPPPSFAAAETPPSATPPAQGTLPAAPPTLAAMPSAALSTPEVGAFTVTATPFQPLPPTPTVTPSPTAIPHITLVFTGAIVPARCVQAEIDRRGEADYLYAEIHSILSGADLTIGTLNASLSDYPPRTGCVETFVLVGSALNADALAAAGFDGMSVATNHIKNCGPWDCGDRAFLDTLENLRRVNIWPLGAGETHAAAMQPVVATIQGVRFGFVSLGQIETSAFAGDDSPGIAELNEENLRTAIAAARAISDVVIVMPHWGPEYSPNPNWSQRGLARAAVDAGADLVVGNHTHVVQAVQELDGVTVFYGLGSLVFDQNWSRETQQGLIVRVTFAGAQMTGYELIPTHVDGNGTVHLAEPAEAEEILARVRLASDLLE